MNLPAPPESEIVRNVLCRVPAVSSVSVAHEVNRLTQKTAFAPAAELRCQRCKHEWVERFDLLGWPVGHPGGGGCICCAHIYVDWVNYDSFARWRKRSTV